MGTGCRKEASHAGLWPGSLLLRGRGRAGRAGSGVFVSMPSFSVTLINGDRSRSLQAAKLRLTAEDRDGRGTATILKDRDVGQM